MSLACADSQECTCLNWQSGLSSGQYSIQLNERLAQCFVLGKVSALWSRWCKLEFWLRLDGWQLPPARRVCKMQAADFCCTEDGISVLVSFFTSLPLSAWSAQSSYWGPWSLICNHHITLTRCRVSKVNHCWKRWACLGFDIDDCLKKTHGLPYIVTSVIELARFRCNHDHALVVHVSIHGTTFRRLWINSEQDSILFESSTPRGDKAYSLPTNNLSLWAANSVYSAYQSAWFTPKVQQSSTDVIFSRELCSYHKSNKIEFGTESLATPLFMSSKLKRITVLCLSIDLASNSAPYLLVMLKIYLPIKSLRVARPFLKDPAVIVDPDMLNPNMLIQCICSWTCRFCSLQKSKSKVQRGYQYTLPASKEGERHNGVSMQLYRMVRCRLWKREAHE